MQLAWKKNLRASLLYFMHQDHITNKVSTVAERVHLVYWVIIASLQILVNRIGHYDRLRDLRHTSSTTVT